MALPGNAWQYSRWVYIVGRSLRMNNPSVSERTAVKIYVAAEMVLRPWIVPQLAKKSTTGSIPLPASETDYALAKMVQYIGRDLKKIPMTIAEKNLADALFTATGTRRLGTKGGPAGSIS